jgi:steroid 5-alpha reductase family enzyme
MAKEHPRIWWALSFFAVGLAQQPMLCGITLPLYSVHFSSNAAFGILDYVACALCLVGLTIAWVADNQLRDYMMENERRAKERIKV